jgi:hypothetical protein
MPEAAMNKESKFAGGKYDVRLPWQSSVVKSITQASRMQRAPDK